MPLETCTTDEIVNSFPTIYLNRLISKSEQNQNIFCNIKTGLSFLLRFIKPEIFDNSIHDSDDSISYRVKSIEQVLEVLNGLEVYKTNTEQIVKSLYSTDISEVVNDRPFYMTLQLREILIKN